MVTLLKKFKKICNLIFDWKYSRWLKCFDLVWTEPFLFAILVKRFAKPKLVLLFNWLCEIKRLGPQNINSLIIIIIYINKRGLKRKIGSSKWRRKKRNEGKGERWRSEGGLAETKMKINDCFKNEVKSSTKCWK